MESYITRIETWGSNNIFRVLLLFFTEIEFHTNKLLTKCYI